MALRVGACHIGFLANGERFFPDFILWLKGPGQQDIVFIELHGMLMDKHPENNSKVQFYKGIKDYENTLNEQANRDDVMLHSYIVSRTDFTKLGQHFNIKSSYPTL